MSPIVSDKIEYHQYHRGFHFTNDLQSEVRCEPATVPDGVLTRVGQFRVGHAYAKYAKYADYAHMRNMRMRMRIENVIHIFHIQRKKIVFLKGNKSGA